MGSIGWWDQIYLIWQIPNYRFLHNVCLVHSVIRINWFLESVCLCPKVIPLSSFHKTISFSLSQIKNTYRLPYCIYFQFSKSHINLLNLQYCLALCNITSSQCCKYQNIIKFEYCGSDFKGLVTADNYSGHRLIGSL